MKVREVVVVMSLAPLVLLGVFTFLGADTRDAGVRVGRPDIGWVPTYPLTSAGRAHFER